ncbi:MAG TPA: hypothetical protein VFM28_01085 [Nitrososphaeraceae archaeon]|jgi:hypothetical protein|nr:hypothetical protein [Nitrososphaeraceae archaeon]
MVIVIKKSTIILFLVLSFFIMMMIGSVYGQSSSSFMDRYEDAVTSYFDVYLSLHES